MKKKSKYIQIRVNEDFKNKVEYLCELEYTTISSLVTRLLAEYVLSSDFDKESFNAWLIESGKGVNGND